MPMTLSDFEFVQKLVQQKTAIILDTGKQYFVESRLSPLAEELGYKTIGDLVADIRAKPFDSGLMEKLVESITIHETSFFRDIHPFKCIKEVVMPSLLKSRADSQTLNIWCAASSSGQEPYTVAMLLRENFPQLAGWRVRFIATDISNAILAKAREGRYNQLEVNRGLPAPLLIKYFDKKGLEWQVKPNIRSSIEFRQLNLVDTWFPMPRLDLILLRNVLIYFNVETKQKLLSKVKDMLNPDGFLLLGAAEMPLSIDKEFNRIEFHRSGCYQLIKGR